jgi:sterol desaturase/sphingolipid hydroxylase (fatty acid hydroxylase superfamily)
MDNFYNTVFSFMLFFIVFLPLERLFAFHKQQIFRREWGTDLLFFAGQFLIWTSLTLFVLTLLHSGIDALPIENFREAIAQQPWWLQFIEVVLLCDFSIYWMHRLSHHLPLFLRFHRVHHTAEKLDWLAAYREHPLDNVYTRVIENLPALILGFPLETIAGFMMFRGIWALFIHSNADIPIGPLKYILGSPRLHHWHHEIKHNASCNFANLMPLMDILFGTFYDPDKKPKQYGISEEISHNYFAQIIMPFIPDSLLLSKRVAEQKAELL